MSAARPAGEVKVRRARPDDLPSLIRMFEELALLQRPWRVFAPRPNLREEMRRRFHADLADPDAELVVGELDGRIVAMAEGHLHRPSTMSDELAVELGSVYVDPDHRGRGVAAALTAEVARFARRRGVERLTLKTYARNEEALVAWQRLGFEPRMIQMTAPVERLTKVGRKGGHAPGN